jgi:hypothetical protein
MTRGELLGALSLLARDDTHILRFSVRPGSPLTALEIPIPLLEKSIVAYPSMLAHLFDHVVARLSPVVFLLDWSLEWLHLKANECLARKGRAISRAFCVRTRCVRVRLRIGDEAQSMYLVLSGSVCAARDDDAAGATTISEQAKWTSDAELTEEEEQDASQNFRDWQNTRDRPPVRPFDHTSPRLLDQFNRGAFIGAVLQRRVVLFITREHST